MDDSNATRADEIKIDPKNTDATLNRMHARTPQRYPRRIRRMLQRKATKLLWKRHLQERAEMMRQEELARQQQTSEGEAGVETRSTQDEQGK